MPPQAISIALFLLQEAIKDAPAIAVALRELFNNPSPSPADWQRLHDKVAAKKYKDYVPASSLPAETPVPIPVTVLPTPASVPAAAPVLAVVPAAPIGDPGQSNPT